MKRPVSSDRVVIVGFAGLLILTGGLVIDATRQIRDVSKTSAALRKQSRDRDAVLDQLRADTYRSATLVRDYMLERDDARASNLKRELLANRARATEDLHRFGESAPPEEKSAVQTLKQRSAAYWGSLAPTLEWSRSEVRQRGEEYLQATIVPRRDEMVQFVRQASTLDEQILDTAESRIQVVQARFERRVVTIAILTLLLGSILAAVVVRQVHRSGMEAAARLNEILRARENLKRLSDRLVEVQEEERRSLSRELHDDLGQTMSAMLMELGKLESSRAVRAECLDQLESIRRLAEENVVKVRNMALLLRPGMLDELGLVPALRWQAKEVGRRTGLRVKVIADELQAGLPDSYRTCIYRVVQEALNNCVKHSRAREVRVVLQQDERGLSISVHDDGAGFEPQHNRGLGLLGMTERVRAAGGRFHIESQPGRGTLLSAYFSLEGEPGRMRQESLV
jgi:signal transduction histidine kinase